VYLPHCDILIARLRQAGLRITPQREMIVEAIAHSASHLTAEEIYLRVSQPARPVNLATVYRTLELLTEMGFVSRLDLGGGQVSYAAQHHGSHIHLVCRRCGTVIDAEQGLLEALRRQLQAQYHFAADLGHISVPGLCVKCAVSG